MAVKGRNFKVFFFLFFATYIFIYINSNQFILTVLFDKLWEVVVPKFAQFVGASKAVSAKLTGSGDTLYNWYSILLFLVISLFTALGLSFIKDKLNFSFLKKCLFIGLRYFLAFQMVSYGLAKLFSMQFTEPSIMRLEQQVGDMSPMGMLWTFMGASLPYTMFTGVLEISGGLFLLSRRTTTLGALMTFGVMLNVMMMNYCYDVPVKLLSTHMVLFALILISVDFKRLYRMFVLGAPVPPLISEDIVPRKWQKLKNWTKWPLMLLVLTYSFYQLVNYGSDSDDEEPKVLVEGAYKVEHFSVYDSGIKNDSLSKTNAWSSLYPNKYGWAKIKFQDNNSKWYKLKMDSINQTFQLLTREDTIGSTLFYNLPTDSTLTLQGYFEEDSISLKLNKINRHDFRLVSRGFNWVQEYPYNR